MKTRPSILSHYRFQQDNRAQSIQIGFILILTMLVTFAGIYQSTVVSSRTESIESTHYSQIQEDLAKLHEQTTSPTATTPITIHNTINYPTSVFLYPPDHGSSLATKSDPATITLNNASASTFNASHLNGSELTLNTQILEYRPYYTRYSAYPVTLEHGTLTTHPPNEDGYSKIEDTIINDRTINLVSLHGDLRTTRETTITAHERAPRPVEISNTGSEPITISLETTLSESKWNSLLADERSANGGHVTNVEHSSGTPYNTVTLTLETDVTYQLYTYRNTLSGNDVRKPGYYLYPEQSEIAVPEENSQYLTVEVRDKWNRPVSGETINASTDSGSITVVDSPSNSDGKIRLRYTAPETHTDDEQVDIELGLREDPNSVAWDESTPGNRIIPVTVMNSDGS